MAYEHYKGHSFGRAMYFLYQYTSQSDNAIFRQDGSITLFNRAFVLSYKWIEPDIPIFEFAEEFNYLREVQDTFLKHRYILKKSPKGSIKLVEVLNVETKEVTPRPPGKLVYQFHLDTNVGHFAGQIIHRAGYMSIQGREDLPGKIDWWIHPYAEAGAYDERGVWKGDGCRQFCNTLGEAVGRLIDEIMAEQTD